MGLFRGGSAVMDVVTAQAVTAEENKREQDQRTGMPRLTEQLDSRHHAAVASSLTRSVPVARTRPHMHG